MSPLTTRHAPGVPTPRCLVPRSNSPRQHLRRRRADVGPAIPQELAQKVRHCGRLLLDASRPMTFDKQVNLSPRWDAATVTRSYQPLPYPPSMSVEPGLFGDEPEETSPATVSSTDRIADWQVTLLRRALDAAGATTMEDRQKLIEELAGRPVASLRDLDSSEARILSERLAAKNTKREDGSAWDRRDGNTWIDRL